MNNQPPGEQPTNVPPYDSEPRTAPAVPPSDFAASAAAAEPLQSPYEQMSHTAPKRSKKGLIIGVVAGVLLLIGGGAAAAYNFWYQNPQKVVTDAIVNAFKAKSVVADGTFVINYKGDSVSSVSTISLTVDSKATAADGVVNAKLAIEADGKAYDFSGSALFDREANIYFKVNDVQKTLDSLLDEYGLDSSEVPQSVTDFAKKIDGRWIRVGADDIAEYSEEAAEQRECLANVYKKYESDQQLQQQLADAYRNNQFIVIKEQLGSRDGALGYVIDGDEAKAKSFVRAAQDTQVYKDVKECDDSFDFDVDDLETTDNDDAPEEVRLELWITRFGHELQQTKLTVKDDEADAEVVVNTQFNQDVTIDVPTEFVSLKELIADIEAISAEMWSSPTSDIDVETNYQNELEFSFEES